MTENGLMPEIADDIATLVGPLLLQEWRFSYS
jgi:hypothetical protein